MSLDSRSYMYQGKYTLVQCSGLLLLLAKGKNGKMNPSIYNLKDVSISKCEGCIVLPFHFSESPGSIVSSSQ